MARPTKSRASGSTARFLIRPLFAALVASGVVAPHAAHAATISVTTGGDAGAPATCTLRQAFESINNGGDLFGCSGAGVFGTNDIVDLTLLSGTITLAGTQIPVDRSTTVVGPGATTLAVSGGGASRVFGITSPNVTLQVNLLTVMNGRAEGPGGCIGSTAGEDLAVVNLANAVVSGCTSVHDPANTFYLNGIGGGIAAYAVGLVNSTVSGNTAANGGGGIFGKYVSAYRSVVANNTVTGQACDITDSDKYCVLTLFGGGGILSGSTQLFQSTVSGNTVNASRLTDETDSYNVGIGGGITQLNKYDGADPEAQAKVKGGVFGNRDPAVRPEARKQAKAAFKAAGARLAKPAAPAFAKAGKRPKADGYGDFRLALHGSTVSGNRVQGDGTTVGKYAGGGLVASSTNYNAEIANSTISGNSLDPDGNNAGAAIFADSLELTSSTVTGNTGANAIDLKYENPSFAPTAKSGKRAALPALAAWKARAKERVSAWRQESQVKAGGAVMKAASAPIFLSSIVAGNSGGYDVSCFECTIDGLNNLIRTKDPLTTVPPDTIQGQGAGLAPLTNNGGVIAGAPGHLLTGPNRTHRLFTTSPAVNQGNDLAGFTTEQRGDGFPRVIGPAADIGATEGTVQAPTPGQQAFDPAHAIPVLGPWLLGLLSAMLGAIGLARRRRPS